MLQVISIRIHRILDFVISLFLICFSWISNMSADPIVPGTMMMAGIFLLSYGLFTQYKKKGKGVISLKAHLLLDFLLGILLAVSPWVFGFSHVVYLPHVTTGVLLGIIAVFSRSENKRSTHRVSTEHRHSAT
jgi:VanZ family protein